MAHGDRRGTLVIRSLRPLRNGIRHAYLVTFTPSDELDAASPYRCPNDFVLLRLLEELLPSPELRLRTLEQVRDGHEISVPNVVVPGFLLARYGFGGERSGRARHATMPRCVVCSLPTTLSNRLMTLSGEVVHYECRTGSGEILETAARLLLDSPGRALCHTCLAGALHIGFDEARKVVGQLRMRADMIFGTGLCSGCSRHRITLSSSASEAS